MAKFKSRDVAVNNGTKGNHRFMHYLQDTDKMEATEERKLDFAPTASIDKVALNNKVVNMRSVVQRAKLYVINDLTKKMKKLRNKKGSDEQKEKNSQKADRLVEEMKIIKPSTTMEQRALARLSEQKFIQEKVNGFRSEHADWKDLAAFLITKHTAREFQKKKSKEKLQKLETNVKASETLIQTYLGGKLTSIKAGKSDDSSDGDDVDDSHGATNEHLHKSDIQEANSMILLRENITPEVVAVQGVVSVISEAKVEVDRGTTGVDGPSIVHFPREGEVEGEVVGQLELTGREEVGAWETGVQEGAPVGVPAALQITRLVHLQRKSCIHLGRPAGSGKSNRLVHFKCSRERK
ncbi:SRFB1-like protein [Mya arenaria]|uniref:SRFB1-like protein n=1 Tax=Mya arenaria TaxID=6604 RepID=A0ABY7DTI2_MYAAR|nr:SRFB1-like protein [Mya arenaria]